ncbi:MAG: hypothetical protein OIF35_09350 [Cellvibrionaceae bacterium]|nr:hypothetical protein [Cellvibrionaceae bacterium]
MIASVINTLAKLPGFNAAGLNTLHCADTAQGHLQVCDDGRYRALVVDGCVQSVLDRQYPQRPCLPHTQLAQLALLGQPQSLLMAGLGGGDLLRVLAEPLAGAEFYCVESCPAVIDSQRIYFAGSSPPQLTLLQQDINDFILRCQRRFDLIVLDVFCGASQPQWMLAESFYQRLRALLNTPGQLLINLAVREQSLLLEFALMLRQLFDRRVLFVPLSECDNFLVLAYKGRPPLNSNGELQQALQRLQLPLQIEQLQAVNICADDGELALWAE